MSRQIRRWCQILFYVSSLSAMPLDEANLAPKGEVLVKTYPAIRIHKLKNAVRPRTVRLLDTVNLREKRPFSTQGVLFTYKNPSVRKVFFVSDIHNFEKKPMRRSKAGVWYYLLPDTNYQGESLSSKVRYKFEADTIFVTDDTHPQTEPDGAGGEFSVFYFTDENQKPALGAHILKSTVSSGKEVLFRIKAGQAEQVSLVGDFNFWNPDADLLVRKTDNVFELRKILPPGEHVFLYKIDQLLSQGKTPGKYKKHPIYGRVNSIVIP